MSARWTPESHVRITDVGMVIEINLPGVLPTGVAATFDKGMLCIHGQHEKFGKFERRFEIPENHNPIKAKVTLENGVLRIEVPSGKRKKGRLCSVPYPSSSNFPVSCPNQLKLRFLTGCRLLNQC
jgi:HSP20 family molecular chaperone IbpA